MAKNKFTYEGKVHEVGKVQNFASGFKKRNLVCAVKGEKYTDYAVFTAKGETCDKIASLKTGDDVTVTFVLDGRDWDGPKGKQWFGGATALKVELASGVNQGSLNIKPAEPPHEAVSYDDVAEDIPF